MLISSHLKERFCKDCKLSIKIFQEPYFTDRLQLYDKIYKIADKWERFQNELEKYSSEQEYLAEYNRVKDQAIDAIQGTEAYSTFNTLDINQFSISNKNLPGKDIYSPHNDKQHFISIDMKKANFSSLRHYDASIFDGAKTWETFLSKFTASEHILESKYIRQVILGNCNCKRHITYEKWLMDGILSSFEQNFHIRNRVVFFSNDEIVLKVSDLNAIQRRAFLDALSEMSTPVELKYELFELHKIGGVNGYYKEIEPDENPRIEFKGLDSFTAPFVFRAYLKEEVTENDKVFWHEGMLAKFLDIPAIEL